MESESGLTIIKGAKEEKATLLSLKSKCTAMERAFAETYTLTLNGTEACKILGYAAPDITASEMLHSTNCRAYIDKIIELSLDSPGDNIKRIQDIAKNDLSKYMVPVKVEKRDMIEVTVFKLIRDLENEQEMEDEFMLRVKLTEKELDLYKAKARNRSQQIARYQIEHERNDRAKKIVPGPAYLATEMVVDLELITKDFESGKIKSFSRLKDGSYKIEMYSALEAATTLARIQGQFKTDNDQKRPIFNLDMENVVFK